MNTQHTHEGWNEEEEAHDAPEASGTPEGATASHWIEKNLASVRNHASYLLGFTNEHGDEQVHPSLGSHVGTSVDRITGPTVRETQYLLASTDEHGQPEHHDTFAKRAGTIASRIVERTVHAAHAFVEWIRSLLPRQTDAGNESAAMPDKDEDDYELRF